LPLLYLPQYRSASFEAYKNTSLPLKIIKAIKKSGKQIIFSHCSHYWYKKNNDLFNKGNNILIRGFDEYLRKSRNRDLQLILIERGVDLAYSKRLVDELGIGQNVTWISEMPRNDIMACLSGVDVGVGELGHSFITYSVLSEFLCSQVPIICKCDYQNHPRTGNVLYPMIRANDAAEVGASIDLCLASHELRTHLGKSGLEWWKENCERLPLLSIEDQIRLSRL
jgi:hypothetical protein